MEGKQIKYISEEELRNHKKKDDLWISILGKAYNVTDWINRHPGGELPLSYFAGQDATDAFLAYHPMSAHKNLEKFFTGYHIKDYTVSEIAKDFREMWSEFHKIGLFDKRSHHMLTLLIIGVMMLFASVYGVLACNCIWVHLTCGGLMGFSWMQFGFMMHESGHYQAMGTTPGWNRVVQLVVSNCLTGFSIAWWKKAHNAHHIASNYLEFDPTTQFLPFLAPSSKAFTSLTSFFYQRKMKFTPFSRLMISYQHLTFFVFLILIRPVQFVQSFALLFSYKTRVPYRAQDLLALLVFWFWFSFLVFCCLPNWLESILFVLVTFAVTGIQSFQITLNHVPCQTFVGPLRGDDWFEKQTSGTLDIACSPWMDWFHGGLQFQIEHHLFPRMPRSQLRKISPLVKELCRKHNLNYNCANSFWEASLLTLNTISDVASEARNFTGSDLITKHT